MNHAKFIVNKVFKWLETAVTLMTPSVLGLLKDSLTCSKSHKIGEGYKAQILWRATEGAGGV